MPAKKSGVMVIEWLCGGFNGAATIDGTFISQTINSDGFLGADNQASQLQLVANLETKLPRVKPD